MKYGDGWEVDRVRCSVLVVKAHPGHHILGEFSFALYPDDHEIAKAVEFYESIIKDWYSPINDPPAGSRHDTI